MSTGQNRNRFHMLRSALVALVLVFTAGVVMLTASPALAETTDYSDLGYPNPTAPCQFGTDGGSTCANPAVPNGVNEDDLYDWFVDENNSGANGGIAYSGNSENLSPRLYYYRNCGDYVAWKLEGLGVPTDKTRGRGNGIDWDDNLPTGVVKVSVPEVGDAAVWNTGTFGHVAFVEDIRTKSSGGYEVKVSEYNHDTHGNGDTRYWVQADDYVDFNGVGTPLGGSGGSPTLNRVTGGGAASTRGDHRLDLFIQGTNTGPNLYHKWSDAAPWGDWQLESNSSTHISSAVASVSWSSNRIDLFARGESGDLLHKWWDAGSGWGDWVSNGGCITGAPSVSSWGTNRLDVFAQGCNTTGPNLVHNWWDGNGWWWETVVETGGARISSSPSATAWGNGRIDLFARGSTGDLLHKWYQIGSGWGDWVSHGCCIVGSPAVATWGIYRLDVFMVGAGAAGNNLWHNWYDGNGWWWEITPGTASLSVTNVLGAVSWGYGRIDILSRSTTGEPLHKWYDGTSWSDWEHLSGGVEP